MLDSVDVWLAARRQPENVHTAGELIELDLGSEMYVAGIIVTQGRRSHACMVCWKPHRAVFRRRCGIHPTCPAKLRMG